MLESPLPDATVPSWLCFPDATVPSWLCFPDATIPSWRCKRPYQAPWAKVKEG
jgi:hypothetical protein